MTQETMDRMAQPAPPDDSAVTPLPDSNQPEVMPDTPDLESKAVYCVICEAPALHGCHRCESALCDNHTYREPEGTLDYCRACADQIVGVCDVCDALHARPCRECGLKVCEAHRKQVIERWGWGGAPGQGGVTSWFPMLRTYCQEHGKNRADVPKPTLRSLKGYDGSSPEW